MKLIVKMQTYKQFSASNLRGVLLATLIGVVGQTPVFAQAMSPACGSLQASYGPFDYRTDHDKLPIVTGAHFTAQVEALIKGTTSRLPGGDIAYTLRAIPNHHRALIAMLRLSEKEKTPTPYGAGYAIECWFERATTFRPDDAIVRMIYSTYLNSKGRVPDANTQLDIATVHAKDNAFTHYNIGLHYFDLKNYDKALAEAHKAIELGFTQIELREQLRSVGKWADPVEAPAAAASAPTSAAK